MTTFLSSLYHTLEILGWMSTMYIRAYDSIWFLILQDCYWYQTIPTDGRVNLGNEAIYVNKLLHNLQDGYNIGTEAFTHQFAQYCCFTNLIEKPQPMCMVMVKWLSLIVYNSN